MEFGKTALRDIYIDAQVSEGKLSEVYLFLIDRKADKSYSVMEKLLSLPEDDEESKEEVKDNDNTENTEQPDLREEFLDIMLSLRGQGIKTTYYAVNAWEVYTYLLRPLKESNGKAKKLIADLQAESSMGEWLIDCMSMARVIPVTVFDEKPELGSNIRKRIKEKYHAVSDEIKKERPEHVFISYKKVSSVGELDITVTDDSINVIEDYRLRGRADDEIMVKKTRDVLSNHLNADILINITRDRLYALIENAAGNTEGMVITSVFSMLAAVGKFNIEPTPISYRDHLLNAEKLRFGRYEDDRIYGVHYIKLPMILNSDSAWKKNFKKNRMWRKKGEEGSEYWLIGGNNDDQNSKKARPVLVGKLSVEKNNEKYVLRCSKVYVKKVLPGFAVLTLGLENHFYPAESDIKRINELCSALCVSERIDEEYPDTLSIQMKTEKKTYSLEAVKRSSAGVEPWLGLMLTMGRRKPNKGARYFGTETLSEKSYVFFDDGNGEISKTGAEETIDKALVRSEYLLDVEKALAETVEPSDLGAVGRLKRSQKKRIETLRGRLGYMVASFSFEDENGALKDVFSNVYEIRKGRETEDRLVRKFDILY